MSKQEILTISNFKMLQKLKQFFIEIIECFVLKDQYNIIYQELVDYRLIRTVDKGNEFYRKEMLDFPDWSENKVYKKVRGLEKAKKIVKKMNDKGKGKKMYKYEKV